MLMDLISRNYYAEKVDGWLGKGRVIVLVGQRRIGKSYVLKDFVLRHKNEPDANVIYIDKEKKEFDAIKDYTTFIDSTSKVIKKLRRVFEKEHFSRSVV